MRDKPIVYDLYTGLHGWLEAFLKEGYACVGYDIVDMCAELGHSRPEGIELRIRDVRSIHGSELKDAACIVASPPCQEPSWRAMPWKRAKALSPKELGAPEPPWWKKPERGTKDRPGMSPEELAEWSQWKKQYPRQEPKLFIELFNACFRIQREASEAAGRHIPMVVENVQGARKWAGPARFNYGSFYFWADVPALMPIARTAKVPGFRFDGSGRSFQTAAVSETDGRKVSLYSDPRRNGGKGAHLTSPDENLARLYADRDSQGVKQHGSGHVWYRTGNGALPSKSPRRRAASAMIAKIPYPLAAHIARTYFPTEHS